MTFTQHAGWHVLIGENGSGKSSFVRAVAICLVGTDDGVLRINTSDWAKNSKIDTTTIIEITRPWQKISRTIHSPGGSGFQVIKGSYNKMLERTFSMAFGPFRRFSGGGTGWESIYKSFPKVGAHLSAFGEDIALTEALTFIRELYIQKLDKKSDGAALDGIVKFVSDSGLLQPGVIIEKVDSEGVFFKDANGNTVPAMQLSDGYRSILSLTFEMFREMIRLFGAEKVFANIEKGEMIIDVEGVVLIDEADAHLHPTWQTRIGQWFVEHFPNIQFIVTTHSPLICRGAEKRGSIWRLAAPGSDEQSGEITGIERDRLIYGDVSEAYGTGAFGDNVNQGEAGVRLAEEVARLNVKSFKGTITEEEQQRLFELRAKLPTAG